MEKKRQNLLWSAPDTVTQATCLTLSDQWTRWSEATTDNQYDSIYLSSFIVFQPLINKVTIFIFYFFCFTEPADQCKPYATTDNQDDSYDHCIILVTILSCFQIGCFYKGTYRKLLSVPFDIVKQSKDMNKLWKVIQGSPEKKKIELKMWQSKLRKTLWSVIQGGSDKKKNQLWI